MKKNQTAGLSDFIGQTLFEISSGVVKANELLKNNKTIFYIRPTVSSSANINEVEFDLALTVDREDQGEIKIGVLAGVFGASGKAMDRELTKSSHRVCFAVGIKPGTDGIPLGGEG